MTSAGRRASRMASVGVPRLVIAKVLNHVEHGVTAVYDRHSYDAEKQEALYSWCRNPEGDPDTDLGRGAGRVRGRSGVAVPKTQTSRKQRGERETGGSTSAVLVVPPDARVETPKPGKTANKVSDPLRGFVVERDQIALWKRLARWRRDIRSPSNRLEQEFVYLWRRGLKLRARLRRVRTHPKEVWAADEVWAHISDAVNLGVTWERVEWKFGGLGGELATRIDSRLRSDEGLTQANKAREAGLSDGLKHKFELMCKHEPRISLRAIARRLLEEKEEDNLRCHDCQHLKWASDSGHELHRTPCERRELYGRCRPCKDCMSWYAYFSEWRDSTQKRLNEKKLVKNVIDKRMCEAIAKRMAGIDLRPSKRRRTGKSRGSGQRG